MPWSTAPEGGARQATFLGPQHEARASPGHSASRGWTLAGSWRDHGGIFALHFPTESALKITAFEPKGMAGARQVKATRGPCRAAQRRPDSFSPASRTRPRGRDCEESRGAGSSTASHLSAHTWPHTRVHRGRDPGLLVPSPARAALPRALTVVLVSSAPRPRQRPKDALLEMSPIPTTGRESRGTTSST